MFKETNQEQVEALAQNMASPGHLYYQQSIHDAFHSREGGDHAAAVAAMEAHWSKQEHLTSSIRGVAAQIGEQLGSGTSFWTRRDATKKKHMGSIMELLEPYRNDPSALAFMFEMLPKYNVDMADLEAFSQDSGYKARFRELLDISKSGEKPSDIKVAGGH